MSVRLYERFRDDFRTMRLTVKFDIPALAFRLCRIGHTTIRSWRFVVAIGSVLTCSNPACALIPRIDIPQYKNVRWAIDGNMPAPVFAIVQGQDGHLWTGSRDGLLRFGMTRSSQRVMQRPWPIGWWETGS